MILMSILPCINMLAPPLAEEVLSERAERMSVIIEKQIYEQKIRDYILDMTIKYNNVKLFLTEETIDLVINNSDVYPSVVVAMAIIETGWGKYAIGNNYFGIKGKGHWKTTKEWPPLRHPDQKTSGTV